MPQDYHESEPSGESLYGEALNLALEALDSVDLATDDPRTRNLAAKIKESLEGLESKTPKGISVNERKVRQTDRIKGGEHAGIWIVVSYPEEEEIDSLDINIYGGIRDPKSKAELQDTLSRAQLGETHEERTLGLGDKSTQINIQLSKGVSPIGQLWIVDTPGNRPSIAITSLETRTPEGEAEKISDPIRFDKSSYQYKSLHGRIQSIVVKSLSILP